MYSIIRLSFAVIICLLLAACWSFTADDDMSPARAIGQWRHQMPGPGMMGWGSDQMPRHRMMDQSIPPPLVTPAPTATPGGVASVSYRQNIQPIFDRECVSCHGGQAGLYLDTYDHLMGDNTGRAIIIPDNPSASELVKRIQGTSQPRMPLGESPLDPTEITAIVTWIAEGSPNN